MRWRRGSARKRGRAKLLKRVNLGNSYHRKRYPTKKYNYLDGSQRFKHGLVMA
jgi:hypothetical protein